MALLKWEILLQDNDNNRLGKCLSFKKILLSSLFIFLIVLNLNGIVMIDIDCPKLTNFSDVPIKDLKLLFQLSNLSCLVQLSDSVWKTLTWPSALYILNPSDSYQFSSNDFVEELLKKKPNLIKIITEKSLDVPWSCSSLPNIVSTIFESYGWCPDQSKMKFLKRYWLRLPSKLISFIRGSLSLIKNQLYFWITLLIYTYYRSTFAKYIAETMLELASILIIDFLIPLISEWINFCLKLVEKLKRKIISKVFYKSLEETAPEIMDAMDQVQAVITEDVNMVMDTEGVVKPISQSKTSGTDWKSKILSVSSWRYCFDMVMRIFQTLQHQFYRAYRTLKKVEEEEDQQEDAEKRLEREIMREKHKLDHTGKDVGNVGIEMMEKIDKEISKSSEMPIQRESTEL